MNKINSKAKIESVRALQILDSRGVPTLSVTVSLSDGTAASAQVPAGTSFGRHEAHELRDGGAAYGGLGVLRAVENIEKTIFPKLKGMQVSEQAKMDEIMRELDGTADKSVLGANAIIGVSLALARAGAKSAAIPLYRYIREVYSLTYKGFSLPQPMFNVLNGGKHANSGMDTQEFMYVPARSESFAGMLQSSAEVFNELRVLLERQNLNTTVGLEGGFAPKLARSREAIMLLVEAAEHAGIAAGGFGIALDVAASELYEEDEENRYVFRRENANFSREKLIAWYEELVSEFPIILIEDGLDQEDWEGWTVLKQRLGNRIKIVGDDLTVTNPKLIKKAITENAINGVIIKPNQIGTLTETIASITLAQINNISLVVSHRSGDTVDDFISDLAVAVNAEFMKSGSVTRGERVAKYNRLLEIEKEFSKK